VGIGLVCFMAWMDGWKDGSEERLCVCSWGIVSCHGNEGRNLLGFRGKQGLVGSLKWRRIMDNE